MPRLLILRQSTFTLHHRSLTVGCSKRHERLPAPTAWNCGKWAPNVQQTLEGPKSTVRLANKFKRVQSTVKKATMSARTPTNHVVRGDDLQQYERQKPSGHQDAMPGIPFLVAGTCAQDPRLIALPNSLPGSSARK